MKSYTNLEQSKKLAEILPIKSADMKWFVPADNEGEFVEEVSLIKYKYEYNLFEKVTDWDDTPYIPCWSLAAFIGVLPEVNDNKPAIFLNDNSIIYPYVCDLSVKADNLIDACYEMILRLYELKML